MQVYRHHMRMDVWSLHLCVARRISQHHTQSRPIENFWVCLTQKVYEGGWEAKTKQQFNRLIESKMKEFDANFVESLLEQKGRSIGDNGAYALFK